MDYIKGTFDNTVSALGSGANALGNATSGLFYSNQIKQEAPPSTKFDTDKFKQGIDDINKSLAINAEKARYQNLLVEISKSITEYKLEAMRNHTIISYTIEEHPNTKIFILNTQNKQNKRLQIDFFTKGDNNYSYNIFYDNKYNLFNEDVVWFQDGKKKQVELITLIGSELFELINRDLKNNLDALFNIIMNKEKEKESSKPVVIEKPPIKTRGIGSTTLQGVGNTAANIASIAGKFVGLGGENRKTRKNKKSKKSTKKNNQKRNKKNKTRKTLKN
jgi:hypothetical protein